MRFPRRSYDEIMAAAETEDWNEADPEIRDAVTDGLAKDLAEPVRKITATRLQQMIICGVGYRQDIVVLEVVENEEDVGMLEARDSRGDPWASAMTIEGLRQALLGMTLPE